MNNRKNLYILGATFHQRRAQDHPPLDTVHVKNHPRLQRSAITNYGSLLHYDGIAFFCVNKQRHHRKGSSLWWKRLKITVGLLALKRWTALMFTSRRSQAYSSTAANRRTCPSVWWCRLFVRELSHDLWKDAFLLLLFEWQSAIYSHHNGQRVEISALLQKTVDKALHVRGNPCIFNFGSAGGWSLVKVGWSRILAK